MQKMTVTKRPGTLGSRIVSRSRNYGKDEKVPTIFIQLTGILLTGDEVSILLQDPDSQLALFTSARSKHLEPRWRGIGALTISDKFKGAKVIIKVDNSTESIVLKPATISGISLDPQVGGLTAMKCMISGVPDEHLQTLTMINRKCIVSILNGSLADRDEGQKELPLGEAGPAPATANEVPAAEATAPAEDLAAGRARKKAEEEATKEALAKDINEFTNRRRSRARDPR